MIDLLAGTQEMKPTHTKQQTQNRLQNMKHRAKLTNTKTSN